MASRMAKKPVVKDKTEQDNAEETASPVPKGSLESIVKKLVKKGKDKGFLTYDEINRAIPAEEFTSDQIDEAMVTSSDVGIQIVENEDDVSEDEEKEKAADDDKDGDYVEGGNIGDDDTGRTDDPVRMYLREM